MEVDGQRTGGGERVDPALLTSLPVRGLGQGGVTRLDVTAHLHPELPLAVEAQQHVGQVGCEDEAARREVLGGQGPVGGGGTGGDDEGPVLVPQRGLLGADGVPRVEHLEDHRGSVPGALRWPVDGARCRLPDVMTPREAPRRSAVIVNPNRVEGLDELRAAITGQLADAGWPEPAWLETTAEDPGTGQARQAVLDGAEVVFVAGGDGTVRACIEGLAGTGVALAVLPGGTGNLLATNLGIPTDTIEGVDLALQGGRRSVDLGYVGEQAFAVMAGMGLDAAMVDDAPTRLKAVLGPVAYVFSALKHLNDAEMKVEVRVDDYPVLRRRARTVVVGNVGRLGAGVNLLPDAVPDNGQMDVAVLAPRNLGHWIQLLVGVLRPGRRRVPNMEVLRGSRIVITSDRPQPRQLDGDVIEKADTLEVTVRADALVVCVYQPDESADLTEGAPEGASA